MKKSAGQFKGVVMLTMLLLIATRLTWLQTSDIKLDISSTFYRTGLWFNQYARRSCGVAPESTFPLPAEMAVRTDVSPPPPTLGELSPGLVAVMIARCQFTRLDVDDFSHWNPWMFMASTLFLAIFTRLIASSWTAGLLAAVTVLSRGTVQSRATLAAAEPFAIVLVCASWCLGAMFVRSLWSGWLAGAIFVWCLAVLFVPSLWISMVVWGILLLYTFLRSLKRTSLFREEARPLASVIAPKMSEARSPRFWFLALLYSLIVFGVCLVFVKGTIPAALDDLTMLFEELFSGRFLKDLTQAWPFTRDLALEYRHDFDLHAMAAFLLLLVHPASDRHLGKTGRSAAICFFTMVIAQIFGSLAIEGVSAMTMSGFSAHVVPSARSMEPLLIAWGTASFWRILDALSGYRLSSSGWSIRGHATINR